jgi:hypothetical protein
VSSAALPSYYVTLCSATVSMLPLRSTQRAQRPVDIQLKCKPLRAHCRTYMKPK